MKDSDITLIGTDHADLLLQRDFRQGKAVKTKAVKIKLGWILTEGSNSEGDNAIKEIM